MSQQVLLLKDPEQVKHLHYVDSYRPHDLMWGLGIENETYLQCAKAKIVDVAFLLKNKKQERYSVNYFNNYRPGVYDAAVRRIFGCDGQPTAALASLDMPCALPVLLNAHSFQKTDVYNQPATTYSRVPLPNPKFCGKTLLEMLQDADPFFRDEMGKQFIFDGDTIEFATTRFYKATVEDVCEELVAMKRTFIEKVRAAAATFPVDPKKPVVPLTDVGFANANHGLATFMTNVNNVAIFNNMTYHFNITLPTRLNGRARVADPIAFRDKHRALMRLIQWLTPLFVARYGARDVLSLPRGSLGRCGSAASTSEVKPPALTKASQRVALSRYIGVGTYDTEAMPRGKLLNDPFDQNTYHRLPFWWYHAYREEADYVMEDDVGCDFNFNKHVCHGIEFRVLDYFPEEQLPEFMRFLVYLADEALAMYADYIDVHDPVLDKLWNKCMGRIVRDGKDAVLNKGAVKRFRAIFQVDHCTPLSRDPLVLLEQIRTSLRSRHHGKSECSMKMIRWTCFDTEAEAEACLAGSPKHETPRSGECVLI